MIEEKKESPKAVMGMPMPVPQKQMMPEIIVEEEGANSAEELDSDDLDAGLSDEE